MHPQTQFHDEVNRIMAALPAPVDDATAAAIVAAVAAGARWQLLARLAGLVDRVERCAGSLGEVQK